ncbi:uncharacterized protein BT62DRAFT_578242 [Guyanagaster necrorhizus]|uniref:Uncharacterized protein n=1 Tax=Guyanagaster necrorhizus TaxID=856835 RepID=A0A9P7VHC8_9AGAR|nr:uncharacterized protein BT62DRAFT_578242 [Guyanagaster necrorhizus MCA 3950]KAG7440612.1 hypothetical protein BT62DRAFT_578242 [Guyanagaster necrorhizus MCA 3950]
MDGSTRCPIHRSFFYSPPSFSVSLLLLLPGGTTLFRACRRWGVRYGAEKGMRGTLKGGRGGKGLLTGDGIA